MAMKYLEEYYIKSNNTILVLGEILDVFVDDHLVKEDGFVDLVEAETATINGLDGYVVPTHKRRLSYQRPKA